MVRDLGKRRGVDRVSSNVSSCWFEGDGGAGFPLVRLLRRGFCLLCVVVQGVVEGAY